MYTMEHYSAIKQNEIMPCAATWVDPEILILNEVSQTNTFDIAYMRNLKKMIQLIQVHFVNELIYKTETDSPSLERNLWLPKGKRGRDKLGI